MGAETEEGGLGLNRSCGVEDQVTRRGIFPTLGQLREMTIVVREVPSYRELVRSENLAPAFGGETAVVLGEVYRNGPDWKFKVVGEGYTSGIAGIAADYGLPL